MTAEQLHLSPSESGDLYVPRHRKPKQDIAGVITSGGRPIKIHVRGKAKQRYKRHTTGRKAPYGTQTRHHYMDLECPSCGYTIVSSYRVRHTYKSLMGWLRKVFLARRFFRLPLEVKEYREIKHRKCRVAYLQGGGG